MVYFLIIPMVSIKKMIHKDLKMQDLYRSQDKFNLGEFKVNSGKGFFLSTV